MNKMNQVQINGIWWDTENTRINGEKYADFATANAYAKKIGKRLPTDEELQALIDSGHKWDEERRGMWFADRRLFLPAEGWKGSLSGRISRGLGYYWSSSASSATYAWSLNFYGSHANLSSYFRADGYSVRCVSDRKDNWWRKVKRWICKSIGG